MSERTYPLPSGDELSIEANESVWLRTGDLKGLISDSSLLIEVLALVDSLQQQVNDQVQKIHMLNVANNIQKDTAVDWDKLVDRVTAERDALRKQLAERDAVIRRLTYKLEEARQALGGGKG